MLLMSLKLKIHINRFFMAVKTKKLVLFFYKYIIFLVGIVFLIVSGCKQRNIVVIEDGKSENQDSVALQDEIIQNPIQGKREISSEEKITPIHNPMPKEKNALKKTDTVKSDTLVIQTPHPFSPVVAYGTMPREFQKITEIEINPVDSTEIPKKP